MLLLSFLLVLPSILVARSSSETSTPGTWSVEYHLSSSTANPLMVAGEQQARTLWSNHPNQQQQQQKQKLSPWNAINSQQQLLSGAEFYPLDLQSQALIGKRQQQQAKRQILANQSLAATHLSLIDLLARLTSPIPRAQNILARSDTKQRPKPAKSTITTASRYLSEQPQIGESTGGVHFDEPLDQASIFEERELDQSGNSNGRDFVALWHDLPQANLITEPRISKLAHSGPTIMDNLIAASKYSGMAAAASAHHQMPAIYSFPVPVVDQHRMLPRKGGFEKSLTLSILAGIGAGILSFLLISNLFLSIPLLVMTLLQFFNGQNMIMPTPTNGQNQNTPPTTTSQIEPR